MADEPGQLSGVSLPSGRDAACAAIALRDAGVDPLGDRATKREADHQDVAQRLELDNAAETFIREHETTWRNVKHA